MQASREVAGAIREWVSSASNASDRVLHLTRCADSTLEQRGWSPSEKAELIVQALNILAVLNTPIDVGIPAQAALRSGA